jgi:hypothetical protein
VRTRFDGTGTGEKGQQASRGFSKVVFLKVESFPEFIIWARNLMFQSVNKVSCTYRQIDQIWQSMPLFHLSAAPCLLKASFDT